MKNMKSLNLESEEEMNNFQNGVMIIKINGQSYMCVPLNDDEIGKSGIEYTNLEPMGKNEYRTVSKTKRNR